MRVEARAPSPARRTCPAVGCGGVRAVTVPAVAAAPAAAAPAWLSEDEFSPLTEVVVGVADGARLPALDRSAWLNLYPDLAAGELASVPAGPFSPRVTAEADEDLDRLRGDHPRPGGEGAP